MSVVCALAAWRVGVGRAPGSGGKHSQKEQPHQGTWGLVAELGQDTGLLKPTCPEDTGLGRGSHAGDPWGHWQCDGPRRTGTPAVTCWLNSDVAPVWHGRGQAGFTAPSSPAAPWATQGHLRPRGSSPSPCLGTAAHGVGAWGPPFHVAGPAAFPPAASSGCVCFLQIACSSAWVPPHCPPPLLGGVSAPGRGQWALWHWRACPPSGPPGRPGWRPRWRASRPVLSCSAWLQRGRKRVSSTLSGRADRPRRDEATSCLGHAERVGAPWPGDSQGGLGLFPETPGRAMARGGLQARGTAGTHSVTLGGQGPGLGLFPSTEQSANGPAFPEVPYATPMRPHFMVSCCPGATYKCEMISQ